MPAGFEKGRFVGGGEVSCDAGDGVRKTCLVSCGTCDEGGGVMEDVSGGAGEVYLERSKCGASVDDEMSLSVILLGANGGLSGMRAGCRLPPWSSAMT
jgi:hypothetical protein